MFRDFEIDRVCISLYFCYLCLTVHLFNGTQSNCLYREENYETFSLFFDLAGTGLKNLDLDYTKQLVNTLKQYYPNALNYIFVFELPWILTGNALHFTNQFQTNTNINHDHCVYFLCLYVCVFAAAFNIIKALLPPKAVVALRFVNSKNLNEYISEENMLTCWGGKDDYQFKFIPEQPQYGSTSDEATTTTTTGQNELTIQKDENDNTTFSNNNTKKVCYTSN